MPKLFIEDLNAAGKRVIVRVDFNVPLKDGVVESDKRIRESLPSIQYLVSKGARTILMSHLGRPKGKVVESMRMRPVAAALGKLLGKEVKSVDACVGEKAKAAVDALKDGEVLVLENLRFHPEEEANDNGFAKELASLADIYVNDAFGTAHRAHASTEGITRHLSLCAAGYLMKKELDYLGKALQSPTRPFVAIIGGAKISGKIDVIESLLPRVDHLIIGGGMTYTFMKAQGLEIGKSLCENDKVALAGDLLKKGAGKIVLPSDFKVTDTFDFEKRAVGKLQVVQAAGIPAEMMGLDVGPASVAEFTRIIGTAKTIVWNGPVGVFEIDSTAEGTYAIARALADATARGATTIVGGGDSTAAVEKAGLESKMSHVSTGGGASLEFLEGKILPGVAALADKK